MKTEQNQNFQTVAWAEPVLWERMKPESVAGELELTMQTAEIEELEQVEAMETVVDQVQEFEQVESVQELPEVLPD